MSVKPGEDHDIAEEPAGPHQLDRAPDPFFRDWLRLGEVACQSRKVDGQRLLSLNRMISGWDQDDLGGRDGVSVDVSEGARSVAPEPRSSVQSSAPSRPDARASTTSRKSCIV